MDRSYLAALAGTIVLLVAISTGCGDGVGPGGALVGGPCATAGQCAQGAICKTGGDYPGGMCTVACTAVSGCPNGSVCVDKSGGICMLTCTLNRDCRADLVCKGKKRVDKQGEALVCAD